MNCTQLKIINFGGINIKTKQPNVGLRRYQKPIEAELKLFNEIFRDNILTDSGLLRSVINYVLKVKGSNCVQL